MRRRPARRAPTLRPAALVVGIAVGIAALLTACAARSGSPDAAGGSLATVADLRGASYVVAGGGTTELHLLCQLTIAAVQAAGARAQDQCAKVGDADVRRSAEQSEVDTGWAYPGRPWRVARDLAAPPGTSLPTDPPASPDDLVREDAVHGVVRLPPTAFSDVDALVVAPAAGVRTVSELAARVPSAVLCATPEAAADPTRLPAVRTAYGWSGPVRTTDATAVFTGVATGRCALGEVPGTSGRIPALGLVALDDDRGALTRGPAGRGGASPILRREVFTAHPQIAQVLAAVTTRLTDPAIRALNLEVDQEGRDPRDVARRWLLAQGLIARG